MASLLKSGQTLVGYEILEQVGKGGMGEVYRARQVSMDRIVALKILSPKLVAKDPAFTERFVAEARAAGRLNHANIIGVHDVGETTLDINGEPTAIHYFSMEFVEGETVKDIIERNGMLPPSEIATIMLAMAEALVYAEAQRVVHRDIKPENIMVAKDGAVKLADLGLAEQVSDEVENDPDPKARKVMGTPMYMSPEQARGLIVGHASDQYSLGATLFHMLTGRAPFVAKDAKSLMRAHVLEPVPDPRELRDDVAEGWRQVCIRLMAKDPAQRFATAVELRAAIVAAISGESAQSRRTRVMRTTTGMATVRRPASSPMVGVGIGAAVLIAAVGGWFVFGRGRPVPPPPVTSTPTVTAPEVDPSLAAARRLVDGLGNDHRTAIAALDQSLADGTLSAAARDVLSTERGRREEIVRKQQADAEKADLARLAAVEQHLAKGNLAQAAEALNACPPDRQVEQRAALAQRLAQARADAAKRLITELAQADGEGIARVTREAATLALAEADAKAVAAAVAARRQQLDELARAEAARAEEEPRWRSLARVIDDQRCLATYPVARSAIEAAIAALPTETARAQAAPLGELATLAGKAENWVRAHCRARQPTVMLRLSETVRKATILSVEDDAIQVRPTVGAITRIPRASLTLDWDAILSQALAGLPSDIQRDGDRHRLAFAAFWNPDVAAQLAKDMGADPLAAAYREIDKRGPYPRLAVAYPRGEGPIALRYDFLPGEAMLHRDFHAQGASAGEAGMVWRPTQAMPDGSTRESDLPTLEWRGRLQQPCTYTIKVRLNRMTQVSLFGIEVEGKRYRVALNTLNSVGTVRPFPIISGENGAFSLVNTHTTVSLDTSGTVPATIILDVDANGRLTVKCNNTVIDANREVGRGAVGLVCQIFQGKPGGWFEIESIEAKGGGLIGLPKR